MAAVTAEATGAMKGMATEVADFHFHAGVCVEQIQERGKGLVVVEREGEEGEECDAGLEAGTCLFTESAVAFHRGDACFDGLCCDACGQWLVSPRDLLRHTLKRAGAKEPSSTILCHLSDQVVVSGRGVGSGGGGGGSDSSPFACNGCRMRWCSERCRAQAERDGHRFLCEQLGAWGRLHEFLEAYRKTERAFPSVAHFGCAARVLAKVGQMCSPQNACGEGGAAPDGGPEVEAKSDFTSARLRNGMEQILGSFHQASLTSTLHAVRTSSVDSMEGNPIFEEHLRPGYRSAYLQPCLDVLRESFAPLGKVFADTLLSMDSFDKMLGVFSTNNFAVEFDSPLESLRAGSPAFAAELADMLDEGRLPAVRGSACFRHFAVLNHSCSRNTFAKLGADGGGLSISVFLSGDVPVGGEVFNCYLPSPEGSALEDREADLCRYLFVCQCERCKQERAARGDSSSDDDDY